MHVLRPDATPDAFFRGVARAPQRVLFLDFDGTLAPFRARPEHAVPYAGVADVLYELARDHLSRVVLVSGRPARELRRATAFVPGAEVWGAHGWQHCASGGAHTEFDPGAPTRARLAAAAARARTLEAYGARVERKRASVAVHWRGLDTIAAQQVEARLRELWRPEEGALLEVLGFDGGVELRARGRDKGTVVREVLAACDPRAASAYLGDDLTDEDAFAAIRSRGLAVLVRPKLRRTRADVWLKPPLGLLAFLRRWRDAACRGTC
jgi:trehalose 6-phosphate phosphatase